MRTLANDHTRFEKTYFEVYKGYYFTGDGCRRDKDGYYWLTGESTKCKWSTAETVQQLDDFQAVCRIKLSRYLTMALHKCSRPSCMLTPSSAEACALFAKP